MTPQGSYAIAVSFIPPERQERVRATFLARCEPATSGCIEWRGCTAEGYGRMTIAGRSTGAHRVAWMLTHGTIPDGLVIDHLCRNRRCVNVNHLEPVTPNRNTFRGHIARGVGIGRTA